MAEFVRERLHWIELEAASADPAAPSLLRALALLVEPEEQVAASSAAIRQRVAYREIFGQGRQEGRQAGELEMVLRLLARRCGALNPEQQARIRSLPLARLEALAEALLDFPRGPLIWLPGWSRRADGLRFRQFTRPWPFSAVILPPPAALRRLRFHPLLQPRPRGR